jgi:translation initiation factor 1
MMRENLFEMGADFGENWSADNKKKSAKAPSSTCKETLPPEKHQLHFAKEKRRGKIVTIVKPFCLDKRVLQSLLKTLKKKLGTGGTSKENWLEFQGDIPNLLQKHLETMGYRFKK